jgi:ABC-type transporter Mla subunit MlaD
VRTDSVAAIRTEGLVGGQYLQIASGTEQGAVVPANGSVPTREPFDVADVLEQMSKTVGTVNDTILVLRADVEKALDIITDTTGDIDAVVQDVGGGIHAIAVSGKRVAERA